MMLILLRKSSWVLCGTATALLLGCTAPAPPETAVAGREMFDALQQAVEETADSVGPFLALVKRQSEKSKKVTRKVGGRMVQTTSSEPHPAMNGILLTMEGHVLVQQSLQPDLDDRIEVWIGEDEYQARPIKVDKELGMTILKMDADRLFEPIEWAGAGGVAVGEWVMAVTPGDENRDFERFVSLGMCRGMEAGRYRKFKTSGIPGTCEGVPAMNLKGEVIGIVKRGGIISIADLREDLDLFLAEATGVRSPEEEKRKKAWLGVATSAISKPYARLKGLPASGQWIHHVAEDSPAQAAGLQEGDLILRVNGSDLRFSGSRGREYFNQTLRPRRDVPFTLTVLRDGQEVDCHGVYTKKPELAQLRAEDIGVSLQECTKQVVFSHNFFADTGVRVIDVHKGSPAATGQEFRYGLLMKNDIIVELAGQPTPDIKAFSTVLEQVRREKPSVLLVKYVRGRETGYAGLNLRIGAHENGAE
jgi:serine protease Do